jgi:general secretion pathway protein G
MRKVKSQKSKVKSVTYYVLRVMQQVGCSTLQPRPRTPNSELHPTGYWLLATGYCSRGFTLIEIMVVVFILGLLVTLVAPRVMGRTDEAKRTKAAADLRAVQQALNLYRLDNGGYPTTDQGLQALVAKPQSGTIPVRWNPEGYLEKVQADPWGHPYMYLSNGERYTLKSLGADGEEGGEGKYADLDSRDL